MFRPESPTGLSELASGADALYLSGRAELPPKPFEVLEERRSTAPELEKPVPLPVGDLVGRSVEPRAFGKHGYRRHGRATTYRTRVRRT